MKAVFDSNVYLAATKPASYSFRQLERFHPGSELELFISPEIIVEIRSRTEYKMGLSREQSAGFIDLVLRHAALVQPTRKVTGVLAAVDGHIILECGVTATADVIFTADRGLLRLQRFEGINIVHPTMLQYV